VPARAKTLCLTDYSINEGNPMNRFLIYFSEALLNRTTEANAAIQELNKIGVLRPADLNISVLETQKNGSDVFNAIAAQISGNAAFFVATVEQIGMNGDYQFGSTLELVDKQKHPPGS
jgi:hypothetical protein